MSDLGPCRKMRFGAFEVDMRAGELRKHGIKVKLQDQPFQLLTMLLAAPGEVVTREELRTKLWPADTFVDFDTGLNTAVKRLRDALQDSAESPRYVQTLPRKGYRLIAQVERSGQIAALNTHPPIRDNVQLAPRSFVRQWVVGIAIVMALTIIVSLWRSQRRAAPAKLYSVAVLPLENLSRDPDQEYFADGMTDELIVDLAKIRALRVVSHTSVKRYKHTTAPLLQVGKELNVDAVVEGSVLRAGDRVRISAQLIETSTDRHLWAESYEREIRGVIELQDDIARAIAKQVQAKLTPAEEARLTTAAKVDPEAYELYLKGRYEWAKRGRGLSKGLEFFKQAVAHDPNYAPAYADIAESYALLGNRELMPSDQAFPEAKSAALKALELDPNLSDGHTALAKVLNDFEWDWVAAEKEYRRAIELNSNDATAHHFYAMGLVCAGRAAEAIKEIERARELDPAAVQVNADVALVLLWARQYDRAIAAAQKTLELEPDNYASHIILGISYLEKGSSEKSVSEFEAMAASSPPDPSSLSRLVYAYAMTGQKERAVGVLHKLKELSVRMHCPPTMMAIAYGALGQKDEAFAWLDKAFLQRGGTQLLSIKVNPLFDPLRSDPRFIDMLRRRRLEQ